MFRVTPEQQRELQMRLGPLLGELRDPARAYFRRAIARAEAEQAGGGGQGFGTRESAEPRAASPENDMRRRFAETMLAQVAALPQQMMARQERGKDRQFQLGMGRAAAESQRANQREMAELEHGYDMERQRGEQGFASREAEKERAGAMELAESKQSIEDELARREVLERGLMEQGRHAEASRIAAGEIGPNESLYEAEQAAPGYAVKAQEIMDSGVGPEEMQQRIAVLIGKIREFLPGEHGEQLSQEVGEKLVENLYEKRPWGWRDPEGRSKYNDAAYATKGIMYGMGQEGVTREGEALSPARRPRGEDNAASRLRRLFGG